MMDLRGQLLLATPDMDDPYFEKAVIYICEQHERGAMGLMISSPTDLSIMELLSKMNAMMAGVSHYDQEQLVLHGGPVNPNNGFILHTPIGENFNQSMPTGDFSPYMLTTSNDIFDSLGNENAPAHFLVCLGCCIWYGGQLEQEMRRNYWLNTPANDDILFKTSYLDRWQKAYEQLGSNGIMSRVGRA